MNATAITLRIAQPDDAQAIALMSRDLIEAGLGWKYEPDRIRRSMNDRETVTLVASVSTGKACGTSRWKAMTHQMSSARSRRGTC